MKPFVRGAGVGSEGGRSRAAEEEGTDASAAVRRNGMTPRICSGQPVWLI